ncbi:MAG TPA: universal stress protein [Anaerolineae bacterium]|nr:universal stress protein [Anaerolineae bacterium]
MRGRIGAYGHDRFLEIVYGSTVNEVAHQAIAPVLIRHWTWAHPILLDAPKGSPTHFSLFRHGPLQYRA